MVDNQRRNQPPGRFQSQAELLMNRREQFRLSRFGGALQPSAIELTLLGSPFKIEIESPRKPGLVHHRTVQRAAL